MSAKTQIKNSIHNSETTESFHSNFVFKKSRPYTASHQRAVQQRERTASHADPVVRPPPQHLVLEQKIAEINLEQRRRTKMLDRRSENEKLRQAKLAAELAHSGHPGQESGGSGPAKAIEIAKSLDKLDKAAEDEKRLKTEKSEKSRQDALGEQPVDGMMKEHLQRKAFLSTSNLLAGKSHQRKSSRVAEDLERPQQLVGHEAATN